MEDNKYQITKTVRFKLKPVIKIEKGFITEEEAITEEEKSLFYQEKSSIKKELLKIKDENNNEVNLEEYLETKSNVDESNMSELITLRRNIFDMLDNFKHLIFKTDKNNQLIKKDTGYEWRNIDIKYTFLRNYLKNSFYRFIEKNILMVQKKRTRNTNYTIKTYNFLEMKFLE